MRRTIALTAAGLATAAALAPLPSASASCTDLSSIGGPKCANLCPGLVVRVVNDALDYPLLNCTL